MTTDRRIDAREYVSARCGERLTGVGARRLPRLAESHGVRVLRVPGMSPRYHRDDLMRAIQACVSVAGEGR